MSQSAPLTPAPLKPAPPKQERAAARPRPLSPHLSIWKWGPHMAVSIAHRASGVMLATLGTAMFVWWLAALASGPESYANFHYWVVSRDDDAIVGGVANALALIVAIGLTLAFFTHLGNGVRHLFLDIGAGYELRRNKLGALAVFAFGVTATAITWAFVFMKGL